MTRNGKIARLPRPLQDELNRRLERGLPGRQLVTWLNALPEVQEVLHDRFDGKPVSEQNLSEWRQGGFVEWQTRNELLDLARDAAGTSEDIDETAGRMAEHAARLLATRYAIAMAAWNGDPDDPAVAGLKKLSPLVRDLATLRRGELHSARVKMNEYAFHRNWESRPGTLGPLPTAASFRGSRLESVAPIPPAENLPEPGPPATPEPAPPPIPLTPPALPKSNGIKPHQTSKKQTPPVKSTPEPVSGPPPTPALPMATQETPPPPAADTPHAPEARKESVTAVSAVPASATRRDSNPDPYPPNTPPLPITMSGLSYHEIARRQDWDSHPEPPRRAILSWQR